MEHKTTIVLRGHLDTQWQEWFEGMQVSHQGADTVLSGTLPDDAALYGVLNKIRDLNLHLLSVNREATAS